MGVLSLAGAGRALKASGHVATKSTKTCSHPRGPENPLNLQSYLVSAGPPYRRVSMS
jgi:hypothetical protein